MLRGVTAPLAAAARDGLNKGVTTLVWAMVVGGLIATGFGLLLATVLIGLSRLMGPMLACGLLGGGLVLLALLIIALRRDRAPQAVPVPEPVPLQTPAPLPANPLDQLAFGIGFAVARAVLAKFDRT